MEKWATALKVSIAAIILISHRGNIDGHLLQLFTPWMGSFIPFLPHSCNCICHYTMIGGDLKRECWP